MKTYSTMHVVKSEDLNHHGTLFAARGAAWIVEAGLVAVALEHGNMDEASDEKELILRQRALAL